MFSASPTAKQPVRESATPPPWVNLETFGIPRQRIEQLARHDMAVHVDTFDPATPLFLPSSSLSWTSPFTDWIFKSSIRFLYHFAVSVNPNFMEKGGTQFKSWKIALLSMVSEYNNRSIALCLLSTIPASFRRLRGM